MQPYLVRRIEHAVLAGHLEATQVIVAADAHLEVVESHPGLVALRLPRLVLRAEAVDLLQAIRQVQGQVAEAVPHHVLVSRVDIVPFVGLHGIVGGHHRAVGNQCLRLELGFAQVGALSVLHGVVIVVRRDFHEIEGYLAQAEVAAPQVDHRGQPLGVGLVGAHVALALVPDDALERIVPDGPNHGVVHQQGTLIGRGATLDGLAAEVYVGIAFKNLAAEPALHLRPAVGRHDDAHGHAQGLLQRRGEEPGRRAELGRGMYGGHFPPAFAIFLRLVGLLGGHGEEADSRIIGRTDDFVHAVLHAAAAKTFQRHLHIALPGGQPDFAHQHAFQGQRLAVVDGDVIGRIACGRCLHAHQPAPLGIGLARNGLSVPRRSDAHRRTRLCPTPQAGVGLLLQQHIIAHEGGQFHFGAQREDAQQKEEGKKKFLHIGKKF